MIAKIAALFGKNDGPIMFTGIIEALGVVESIQRLELNQATVVRLVVATDLDVETLPIGGSIAVDGVCLTIVERAVGRFGADLGPETLALTTLGNLEPGSRVHLERPLKIGDPLGGHMVAGHVDIMGTVVARRPVGASLELDIEAPAQVARFLAAERLGRGRRRQPDGQHCRGRRVLGDADPAHARGDEARRQARGRRR